HRRVDRWHWERRKMKQNHDGDRLQAWDEWRRLRLLSIACPRKSTGVLSSGFASANSVGGMFSWTPIPPQASSISFLTKRKVNPPMSSFASGRRKREV